ncbi:mitochondrial tRNA methylthiotransferase CDK5RAP1-like isoform X2 [Dreissena polymorpha]|uniref:CDK5 regulatory subunit-associated protein 1 n=2 Tax=Dreissena polymorpha TaxID=45954 RepID=A0A9D4HP49_DREPO|nr:mitochondrial tRNA methylthiotransferase CDK5RAP1-like isoform X2 [Dreissena polymorpha]KAH3727812.1 hypothetical protein DPMN_053757 [Dreissena polymorpha]
MSIYKTRPQSQKHDLVSDVPFIDESDLQGRGRKVYFDVHGCQMNTSDTEIAWSVLQSKGFERTTDIKEAAIVLVMTCAIREGAEQKIWNKLHYLARLKRTLPLKKGGHRLKIGILGCMAERLKSQILEREKGVVDLVCGPDAYRDLPRLLAITHNQQTAVNVLLSLEETYADVMPVRLNEGAVSAYVSIMRGCDNMCAYCIVPFTRGRERSRPIDSIMDEIKMLSDQGVREVILLGQNVNSYRDLSESQFYGVPDPAPPTPLREGFLTVYKARSGGRRFADLLDKVSRIDPDMRIRFTSPHPKDFPDEVLELIRDRDNICNQLHLPAQSGNNTVLAAMRRGYTVEAYRDLVARVREILPDVALTSDFISGFCGETETGHQETLALVRDIGYTMVFAYPYSMREKTHAYHRLQDDVPEDVKGRRYQELLQVFREGAGQANMAQRGHHHLVLVEGESKKGPGTLFGKNEAGIAVIFPATDVPHGSTVQTPVPGDYAVVKITDSTAQTLFGDCVSLTSLKEFKNSSSERTLHSQLD